jgi:hypothetical protein
METTYSIYYDPSFNDPGKKLLIFKKSSPELDIRLISRDTRLIPSELIHFSTEIPIREPYDQYMCELNLKSYGECPANLSSAYPQYISIEEVAILFPRCRKLLLELEETIDFSSLSMFHNLTDLSVNSMQSNINGIEYLTNLTHLNLIRFMTIDMCQLSCLQLKRLAVDALHISMRYIELAELVVLEVLCDNIFIENVKLPKLQSFDLDCDSMIVEGNIDMPNLESLSINSKLVSFLGHFLITNKCSIELCFYNDDKNHVGDIIKRARKLVPEGIAISTLSI